MPRLRTGGGYGSWVGNGRMVTTSQCLSGGVAMAKIECNCDSWRCRAASFQLASPLCNPFAFHIPIYSPSNALPIRPVAHSTSDQMHFSRQQPQMLHISLGCQRKWAEWKVLRGGGWDDLTDRQHGRVFSLQLLCQSADLPIYINLLSSGIVVASGADAAAAADAHADIDAFSRNLQVNFASDASTLASAWLTNNWHWQCSI